VPGAEGEFPADPARPTIEDYWRFLVSQPERAVVRDFGPELPEFPANLEVWEKDRGRVHPYRGRLF
jgi:hypothetical protein